MRLIKDSLSTTDKAGEDLVEKRWKVSLPHNRVLVTSDANPMKEVVRILGIEAPWSQFTLYDVYKHLWPMRPFQM